MLILYILSAIKNIIHFLSEAFELYYMDETENDTYKYFDSTYKYKKYL